MIARAINQTGQPQPDPIAESESRAAQWRRRKNLTDLPLPSGLIATVATPDLIGLQRDGGLPEPMQPPVARYVMNPQEFAQVGQERIASPDPLTRFVATADMYAVIDALVVASCVLPRVAFNPTNDDTLHPSEIAMTDRVAIFEWASGLEAGTIAQAIAQQSGAAS